MFPMLNDLIRNIMMRQSSVEAVPSNKTISIWTERLLEVLFPELSLKSFTTEDEIKKVLKELQDELTSMLNATKDCHDCDNAIIAADFFQKLPEICRLLKTDVEATISGDPAAKSEFEVIRAYPGFYALSLFRIAHVLYDLKVPLLPRIITEHAHSKTGIDIHPGANIGEYFMIDHGTGIVIGETTVIGTHVKVYQGVTLGALSVEKSMAAQKRHPTIEDHVIIYSNATILGGETRVGHHSIIGGNVWLTSSVAPGSLVYHKSEITILEGKTLTD